VKARWEYADSPPRSLSGVKLQGTKLSRHIYIDESGISDDRRILVVGGVIIDPDREWTLLEQYLEALARVYVPSEQYFPGFPFHTKDLFHGTGVWDKRIYPRERSIELLKELVGIPAKAGLPVVWGYIKTSEFKSTNPNRKQHLHSALNQGLAFSLCVVAAEQFMRNYVDPNEFAWLFVESNHAADVLKVGFRMLRGQYGSDALLTVPRADEYLPLKRIKESPNLIAKRDSIVLQLADMCVFILRYSLEGRKNCDELFQIFTRNNAAKLPKVGPDDIAGFHSMCFQDPLPKGVAQTDQ
jgi:hypothetical protein